MNLKSLIRAAAVVVLGLSLAASAAAQTTLTSTTLAAAITNAADQTMSIASATGWTATSSQAQTYAIIDREVVGVRSLSSTLVGITRGQYSTRATGHASGARVYFIPSGSVTIGNADRAGACATGGSSDLSQSAAVLPVFNPMTGNAFTCANSTWIPYTLLMGQPVACAVTQATNRTTGVTCQGTTGAITTNNASLAAEGTADFVVTDASVALGDVVEVSQRSGSNGGGTIVSVSAITAGTFNIRVHNGNVAAGTAETGAIIINFMVLKAIP